MLKHKFDLLDNDFLIIIVIKNNIKIIIWENKLVEYIWSNEKIWNY